MAIKILDFGNNETFCIGIDPQSDGTFLALTLVEAKTFKTERGAQTWLQRRGYVHNANGWVKASALVKPS